MVGAGPTGLALAAELRALGGRFRLIDRQLDRVHESRALAIQPRTLEVLARHGVTRDPIPGALHDPSGAALARLGVAHNAHYLVRPDGHIAYRNAGTSLDGVERYLAHWLRGTPAHTG